MLVATALLDELNIPHSVVDSVGRVSVRVSAVRSWMCGDTGEVWSWGIGIGQVLEILTCALFYLDSN